MASDDFDLKAREAMAHQIEILVAAVREVKKMEDEAGIWTGRFIAALARLYAVAGIES